MSTSPVINQWIKISACDEDNSALLNGLQAVIPLNRCIANVDNYQIFQLLEEDGRSVVLGYNSNNSLRKCLKKQDKQSQALVDYDPFYVQCRLRYTKLQAQLTIR